MYFYIQKLELMKISILNGDPNAKDSDLNKTIFELENTLRISGHSVETFVLRDMNIRYCEGCFNCWFKNPGECSFIDDTQTIRRSYINSDLVIFASPILMGFTSALLKKATDKLIPLLLPYFDFVNSEVHHTGRYENYPMIGVLLEQSEDTDKEDLEIVNGIYSRIALNLKTSISFTFTSTEPIDSIVHEINCI